MLLFLAIVYLITWLVCIFFGWREASPDRGIRLAQIVLFGIIGFVLFFKEFGGK